MSLTVAADLHRALGEAMEHDERVVFLGEDVLAPYGGAFKVAGDLCERFPDRVIPMPISEATIVGMATGMALRGMRPVAEIMFGDFLMLAADQLVNHAAKLGGMYDGQAAAPVVVRTPSGGGRGYGPTHSQSLEKHFLGVPGLRVVAVSHFVPAGELLAKAIFDDPMPVLFIEHKLLYARELVSDRDGPLSVEVVDVDDSFYPSARVANYSDGAPDVTLTTYGGMALPLEYALRRLADEEIRVEALLPVELSRPWLPEVAASVGNTRRLVVVEEGAGPFGWGAGVVAELAQRLGPGAGVRYASVTAAESVVPAEKEMEHQMLPSAEVIVERVVEVLQ